MRSPFSRRAERWAAVPAILVGAVALRLVAGVGFVNYDTLYALAWGGQLARGETPAYEIPIAPTPHPLLELLGIVLYPLGAGATRTVTVALAFIALAGCGWLLYRLGSEWFGRAAGALAALIFLTRTPVLSYAVRAYVDIPFLLLVLGALLVETRRPRAGAPVLALLALAGLLRPEAWAFSGLYWLYASGLYPGAPRDRRLPPRRVLQLAAIAASAPLVWMLSDLAVTGDPLWSLTNTRHTAGTLGRVRGIANVPQYIPRRIGEILRLPVLFGAAVGIVLSLLWLRRRARVPLLAGAAAVLVFAVFAAVGLPINTRYAFPTAAILSAFCGAGAFGWIALPHGDRHRRSWQALAVVIVLALLVYAPAQYRGAHRELQKLAREQTIEDDLVALTRSGPVNLRCGRIGVPNHAPIPLLALYLRTSPANVLSAQVGHIEHGVYVDPATRAVERDYVLDPRDPHVPVSVPPGFAAVGGNASWVVYRRCS
jgi:hypothetical protein